MHHTKTIRDEEIPEGSVFLRQLLTGDLVLGFFPGLETDVLQEGYLTIPEGIDGSLRRRTHHVGGESHPGTE